MAASKSVKNVGENVAYTIDGDTLTVTIDLSYRASAEPAPGKKTIRVASTLGNSDLGEEGQNVRLGINAYVYPPR